MADQTTLTCGNCGRVIGWMPTPSQIKEDVVCGECHERLAQSQFCGISTASAPANSLRNPLRFSRPPKALRSIFWIGLLLEFAVLLDMTGKLPNPGAFSLLWLGAILCAGALVGWAIIVAGRNQYEKRLAPSRFCRISTASAPANSLRNPLRFSRPPKALRSIFWIGLLLGFAAMLDMTGKLPNPGAFSLLWLGAILCAGALVGWAIIVAGRPLHEKTHWLIS